MSAEPPAVVVDRLSKNYRAFPALTDVTFEVRRGEVFGLLGPNGAGKTTFIRTLLDLVRPTRGSVAVFGHDSVRESTEVRRRCAYLPGDFVIPPTLTGRDALRRYSFARRLPDLSVAEALASRVDLDLSRRARELSKGNRQKVGLVLALSTPADLLVLDEPTSGLDPLLQREFRSLVREAVADGTTVLLSSHALDEVEHLADRVAVLRQGRVATVETVSTLLDKASRTYRVRLTGPSDAEAAREVLTRVPHVEVISSEQATVTVRVTGQVDALVKALARFTVESLDETAGDLEDVFLAYYSDGPSGAAA